MSLCNKLEMCWKTIWSDFQINFSELARKYGIAEKAKNGNMVVKEDLEDKAVHQTVQSKQGINQKKFETLAGWRDFSSNSTNKKIRLGKP